MAMMIMIMAMMMTVVDFTLSSLHSFFSSSSLLVYFGKHQHIDLLNQAFSMYSISNPLHPDIWPSVMKFESEIIAMTINLVNGCTDDGTGDVVEGICGSTTSVSIYMELHHITTYYHHLHHHHISSSSHIIIIS